MLQKQDNDTATAESVWKLNTGPVMVGLDI